MKGIDEMTSAAPIDATNELSQARVDDVTERKELAWAAWRKSYEAFNKAQEVTRRAELAFADALDRQLTVGRELQAAHEALSAVAGEWRALNRQVEAAGLDEMRRAAKPSRLDSILRRDKVA